MKHSSLSRVHGARLRRSLWYRPAIELLERRLPPGDMLWTLLLGGSALALDIDKDHLDGASPALRMEEDPLAGGETLRPELVANSTAGRAVARDSVEHSEEPTSDLVSMDMTSPRLAAARGWQPSTGVMAAGFRGLTPPAPGIASLSVIPRGANSVHLSAPYAASEVAAAETADSEAPSESQQSEILDSYGKLPLSFEQNVGQFDDRVDFVSRAGGATVFLTPTSAVFAMQSEPEALATVRDGLTVALASGSDLSVAYASGSEGSAGLALYMQIIGGNPDARATATDTLPGITNYFIGNDPNQWHTNIASFGRVEYDEVYPGIDLAYYGNNNQLEYDFIVSPGADPNAIALKFAGADGVEINPRGDLVVHTAVGDVVQQKPFTYQEAGNGRQEVASGYVVQGDAVRFNIGSYDPTRPLVIDPVVLGYSTYLGGPLADAAREIAVDASGNAYITGYTSSTAFPTKPGSFDTSHNGGSQDAFVTKLNSAGTGLVYSTFLGGSNFDEGNALAIDGSGYAYLTGSTHSTNFPMTSFNFDNSHNGAGDVFVARLNPLGSELHYSTFLGGSSSESATAIAINTDFEAFVTGATQSANFPTTPGAFDTTFNSGSFGDAFVTKVTLIPFVFDLDYSTFLGGLDVDQGTGIAVDGSQNAYVSGYTNSSNFPTTPGAFDSSANGGYEAIVTKLNAAGSALVYSTFLSGSGSDFGSDISVDNTGNAYITGQTSSGDFPVTPGAFDNSQAGIYDGFVTKLNAAGSSAVFSTYLGGTNDDGGNDIKVVSGNVFVVGWTNSAGFPTTPDAFDPSLNAFKDAFVVKMNSSGSNLLYSTYLGGLSNEEAFALAVDAFGSMYVTGETTSGNFPTSHTAFDTVYGAGSAPDAFVTKFRPIAAPCGCIEPHTISTAADGAYSVFATDVDGDGDTDVLSASFNDNKIAWYENNGSQSFIPRTITTAASGAMSVFATDVDGDGDTDVLSASRFDDKIAWYENNGSQLFTARIITTLADNARSVYATDVDGDGDTDVLSASAFDDKIAWYENNGSASFTARTITTTANGAQSVVAADVDGDNDIDVLSASRYDGKIAWYENNGSEVFTARTITTAASAANSVFSADVDGDGDLDVLSASYGDNKIAWYQNDGNQNFTTRVITTTFTNLPKEVFAADVDADGDTDVLSASSGDNRIAWYKNDGGATPSFTAHTITTTADGADGVFAADVDGDGDTDVLSASFSDDKIAWYENRNRVQTAAQATPVFP